MVAHRWWAVNTRPDATASSSPLATANAMADSGRRGRVSLRYFIFCEMLPSAARAGAVRVATPCERGMRPLGEEMEHLRMWNVRGRMTSVPAWLRCAAVGTSALAALAVVVDRAPPAFAVQAKPPTDWSFYVATPDTASAYNLGCNQGAYDAGFAPPSNSLVVLDFGGQLPDGSGSLLINGVSVSNSQIESAAEAFSHGYWDCTGADTTSVLLLGVGTNNSYYDVNSAGGSTWAQLVADINASNKSNGYDAQVSVGGANDMEPGFDTAAHTEDWANGYTAINPAWYVNYGSADGCPPSSASNGACANGWRQYDAWWVSWGALPAFPLPEIYYQVNANQWTMISLYGAWYQGSKMGFYGPLDENDLGTSTFTSDQAWSSLWSDVNSHPETAEDMSYSAQIHR
jgi:hypothetical protein